ncbi:MAG: hypothetical protein JXN60_00175, partial [Lentisphaerae bacterium]|nr:hypothetical protein [Lentisphaerota bacterium]
MTNAAFLTVGSNPWLACSLLFTARVFVPGMAWSWTCTTDALSDSPWSDYLLAIAKSTILGFLIAVLNAFVLSELGLYSEPIEWISLTLLSAVGAAFGIVRARQRLCSTLRFSLLGILLSIMTISLVMLLPARGEWIVGGWDPGIYVNQGMIVERSGTFEPVPLAPYGLITEDEGLLFVRGSENYRECFPGVPIDIRTSKLQHYFFRLMPSAVAVTARCGGLRAATRVNILLGAMVCLALVAVLVGYRSGRIWSYFALFGLITQPIWIYHLRTPTSEMLQLVLLLGICLCAANSSTGLAKAIWSSLFMFAAIINRISFVPFAAIIILVSAILDLEEHRNKTSVLVERIAQFIAISVATAINWNVCSITIVRLKPIMPTLFLVTIVAVLMTIVIDLIGRTIVRYKIFSLLRPFFSMTFVSITLITMGVIWLGSGTRLLAEPSYNLRQLIHYIGIIPLILACFGAILLLRRKHSFSNRFYGILAFLSVISMAMLLQKGIKDLYPWATRRYLVYTIPLIAVLSGYLYHYLICQKNGFKWLARALAVLLLAATILTNGRACWHAWSR